MISVSAVRLGLEEEQLVLQVLRSGQLAQGPMVARLEEDFARIHGVRHAVAVNNGTTALVGALRVLDLAPGDEVITSPFTFVATLNAIIEAGATARFADIDTDFNINPAAAKELIGTRTRVLMPIHLYGLPVDGQEFSSMAANNGLTVVEDAAQAIGASFSDQKVGGLGMGCFSLYATKNVTTGEGGVVTTNNDYFADRLRLLRNQGMRVRYAYEMPGMNLRLTDLAAAVGIPQLRRLDESTARRNDNAKRLRSGLADVPGLALPVHPDDGRTHVYHQFTIRVTDEADLPVPEVGATPGRASKRDSLMLGLAELGVGSGVYYPKVVHDYACYAGHPLVVADPTPVAERIVSEVLSIPVHPLLTDHEIDEVIAAIRLVMGVDR